MTEDKVVGWHHQLRGHEFEQTQGEGEGQGGLACCSRWGSQKVRFDLLTEQQQRLEGSGILPLPASPIRTSGLPRAELCLHPQTEGSPGARD